MKNCIRNLKYSQVKIRLYTLKMCMVLCYCFHFSSHGLKLEIKSLLLRSKQLLSMKFSTYQFFFLKKDVNSCYLLE